MANNIIRTMQGKIIDLAELALRNEDTRSIGNMNSEIVIKDATGNMVATKTHKPNTLKRKEISKPVIDTPVMESKTSTISLAKRYNSKISTNNDSEKLLQEVISKPSADPMD